MHSKTENWMKHELKIRINRWIKNCAASIGAVLVASAMGASAQTTPPPASSFLPALEVACTAQDSPQVFSKRVVPTAPDSQTAVKLILTTDNIPILVYAVVRTSPSSVDVFLQSLNMFAPFPYVPQFRCYEVPIGTLVTGTAMVSIVRAGRTGTFLSNYVRNDPPFDAMTFPVMPYPAQSVPSLTVLALLALTFLLVALALRTLRAGRNAGVKSCNIAFLEL